MLRSNMVGQIDRYMTDRALFSTDIQAKALKWSTNYSHPLAVGYRAAKLRLDGCVTEATARSAARRVAYEQLKARTDFALGIVFGLLAPFASQAFSNLKTSMLVTNAQVDDRVLTRWYSSSRSPTLSFDQLLNRETIRQSVLNHVIEQGTTAAQGQLGASAFSPGPWAGSGPAAPTGRGAATGAVPAAAGGGFSLPENLLTGEFTASEFEQNVQNIFNSFAIAMHDRYLQLFDGPAAAKRNFLINATKSVLACPPPMPVSDIIPAGVLEGQLFGMIAGSYILSFRPTGTMIWPTIGVDLAFTINTALQATRNSIITNNPRTGQETFPGGLDPQMVWDGHVEPVAHVSKIREIGRNSSSMLETFMTAIAQSDLVT